VDTKQRRDLLVAAQAVQCRGKGDLESLPVVEAVHAEIAVLAWL
jgi:hypothetical protein